MKRLLAACALLAAAGSATAQLYVGASAGGTRFERDAFARCAEGGARCDRDDTGGRAYAGLRFDDHWGLEIGAHRFGRLRASQAGGGARLGELRLRGAHLVVANRLDAGQGWFLHTRLGVARNRAEASAPGAARATGEKNAPYLGIGVAYRFTPSLSLRLDLDGTRGEYAGDPGRAFLYAAGLELEF